MREEVLFNDLANFLFLVKLQTRDDDSPPGKQRAPTEVL